ncbi:MAG: VWA domain-containing protein [Planctomycetaceae bacterium]
MNFLNSLRWPGALAFCIPLILHILNRSKFKRIEWGAMHLLEAVVKVNHKRFRLEQLLLLLVRCAIPALLAFALAQPVLTGVSADGDAPVSLVILLDNSYSMDATVGGTSQFSKAVDAAVQLVQATGKGSQVSVIQTGGTPRAVFDQPVFDPDAMVRRLKTLEGGYGASNMPAALDAGLATLAGMTNLRRELIVISDFQPPDWEGSNDVAATIRQQVDSGSFKPVLTLIPIGQESAANRVSGNVAVDGLQFSERPLGVGQQLSVRVHLRNLGDQTLPNARVILKVDGQEAGTSQVSLSGNSTAQTLFPVEFATAGSHVMEAEIAVADDLPTDNRYAATVRVWDEIRVLLVDGDPSSQPLKGETDFVSVALTPFSFGRSKLSDLVKTQTITNLKGLDAETLEQIQVLVLANVDRLKDEHIAVVQNFVNSGGSLLLTAGSRIDTKWYNEKFSAAGLLPAKFGEPQGIINEQGKSAHLVAQHFDHPALEFFNEPSNGDLSTAEVRQWYQLLLPDDPSHLLTKLVQDENSAVTEETVVVARLDSGDPLLVERPTGEGVVLQLATSCDADWTDLPLRPFFVPLMQQLVTTSATRAVPPRNIRTGDPAVAIFRNPSGDQTAESTLTLSMVSPDGSRRPVGTVSEGRNQVARFDATQRPGVYTLSAADVPAIHFVANTSREESRLGSLDDAQLQNLADRLGAARAQSATDYLEQDRLRRYGRNVWRYVLAGLLLFLFLELVLQQRFSRVQI